MNNSVIEENPKKEAEPPILGQNEKTWGPPLESKIEKKPLPETKKHPIVQAPKEEKKPSGGGFGSFFKKIEKAVIKNPNLQNKIENTVGTVVDSLKDGKIDKKELKKIKKAAESVEKEVVKEALEKRAN